MSRPALTVLPLALGAALIGCGGDDGGSSPADAVRAFNGAVADGDGDRACAVLDDAAEAELQQSTQGSASSSCKQVIKLLAAFYDDATKDRLRDVKVEAPAEGERATARFTSPAATGGPEREQTYELRRVDGDWKIDSLGLEPAEPGLVP